MSREFKPGDVAMVTWENYGTGGTAPAFLTANGLWNFADGKQIHSSRTDDLIKAARPLVVLDPESDEDAARLSEALYLAGMRGADNTGGEYRTGVADRVQAALRELANPTPPKPAEPTGLGAVVEDARGLRWVRDHEGYWGSEDGTSSWINLSAVRVLSEGVQA